MRKDALGGKFGWKLEGLKRSNISGSLNQNSVPRHLVTLCWLSKTQPCSPIHPSSFFHCAATGRGGGASRGYKQINRGKKKEGEKEGRKLVKQLSSFSLSLLFFSKQHSTKLEDEFFALSLFLTPNPTSQQRAPHVRARTKDVKTCFRQTCRSFGPSFSFLPFPHTPSMCASHSWVLSLSKLFLNGDHLTDYRDGLIGGP